MAAFSDALICGVIPFFISSLFTSTVHLKTFVRLSFIARKLKMSSNLPGWVTAEVRSLVRVVL